MSRHVAGWMRIVGYGLLAVLASWCAAAAQHGSAADKAPRWSGLRVDGTRFAGAKLQVVPVMPPNTAPAEWQLDGQPLWDAPQPVRWLRDRGVALRTHPPTAFVEMVTGDCLPGVVAGYDDGRSRPFDSIPPHLLVRPEIPLAPPQPLADPVVRVLPRYVRRVVWQRRESETYQPGTVFYRDGRSATFRAVRWGEQGVQLLLAEGPRSSGYAELAELHLPAADFWDIYWEELAALCPQGTGRWWQWETAEGLVITTSRARARLQHPGGPQEWTRWIHSLHPVWSLEALWIPQTSVGSLRSFAVHEAPLSRLAIAAERQQGWITEQGPPVRLNRSVERGPLRGGEGEFSWGFGVQALSRLEFALPPAARVFRSKVGLERAAGTGGCVRARVWLGSNSTPAFDSGFLVGSGVTSDTGIVVLPPNDAAEARRLILEIDAAHEGRPMGADPFDVRDLAAWFDPLVELDPPTVAREIAPRVVRHVPGRRDWGSAGAASEADGTVWSLQWDELAASPGRFLLVETLGAQPLRLQQEWRREARDRWLVVAVHLMAAVPTPPRLEIWIEGELAHEQLLQHRHAGLRDPPPALVALDDYPPGPLRTEIRVIPAAAGAVIGWRLAKPSRDLPTLFPILEDEARWQAGGRAAAGYSWDTNDRVSGTQALVLAPEALEELLFPSPVALREQPIWGEYRFARLSFRKAGRGQISLEFLPLEPRERPLRLDAGPGQPAFGEAARIYQAELPDQWTTQTLDLFSLFGRFEARGLRLANLGGGPCRLDAIYLARTPVDLDSIPFVAGPTSPSAKMREEFGPAIRKRVGPALVTFPGAHGASAVGVLISPQGEVLTTAQALGEAGRQISVTLSDGRSVMARTRGSTREFDLGLLQLEGTGPWPAVELHVSPVWPPDTLVAQVPPLPPGEPTAMPATLLRLRRATRLGLWTDAAGGGEVLAGTPLVDQAGRLVGLARQRHAGGVLQARVVPWPNVAARLRNGEAW
ncbi:MAG: NPCBM/NEW2 domain-containing protein [Pirellulales bacterium]